MDCFFSLKLPKFHQRKKFPKKEDTTKYGEFVCSNYHWLPIEKQKEQAEKLANITKNKKN